MSEKYQPKEGERVRVVLEGEASAPSRSGSFTIGAEHGGNDYNRIYPDAAHVVSIEPPVEVFEEGARIRRVWSGPDYEITVGHGGYLHHQNGTAVWRESDLMRFTSEHYERVPLG